MDRPRLVSAKKPGIASRALIILALFCLLSGCLGIPDQAVPVRHFSLDRYLGTWYEIARLDHGFERGLSHVQAQYSLRDDGGLRVINRGYNDAEGKWELVEGRAYFIGEPDVGRLKVSFFGPFYGAYNIVDLDQENYRYALVVGPDTDYLWILAREPELDKSVLDVLVAKAKKLGFATDALIYPQQGSLLPPVP